MVAAATGRGLSEFIEDTLRETLARRKIAGSHQPVTLRTFKGGGLMSGIDLDDSATLLDLMDRRNTAS